MNDKNTRYAQKRAAIAQAELEANWQQYAELCRNAGIDPGECPADASKARNLMYGVARRIRGKVTPASVFQASLCGMEFTRTKTATTPTDAPVGTERRIAEYARRVERGEMVFCDGDGELT